MSLGLSNLKFLPNLKNPCFRLSLMNQMFQTNQQNLMNQCFRLNLKNQLSLMNLKFLGWFVLKFLNFLPSLKSLESSNHLSLMNQQNLKNPCFRLSLMFLMNQQNLKNPCFRLSLTNPKFLKNRLSQ
jgi:hypothetical protein